MKDKKYFSTGEIVKATGITKDALFHYEKNGLIKPEIIKENGYRYYTSEQFDLLNAIAILRNIGIGISEIKMFLEDKTLENLYKLYDKKEKEIDDEIKALKKTKKILKDKKNNIEMIRSAEIGVVSKEYMKKVKIELSKEMLDNKEHLFDEALSDLLAKANLDFRFNKVGGISSKRDIDENKPRYKHLYVISEKSKYIRPEGDYLVLYHKGYFEDVYKSYGILNKYIIENNIEVEDTIYEEVMLENIAMIKSEPFIMKIMARIK